MPKLSVFDVKAWRKGFAADIFAHDPNARDVNDNPIPGKVLVHTLRYKVGKPENVKKPIEPQVPPLTQAGDNSRTLEEHRARVEKYAKAYANGFDPLTGTDLRNIKSFEFYDEFKDEDGNLQIAEKHISRYRQIDEFEASQKDFTPPTYSVGRNIKVMENDGMALLTQCFAQRYTED